jgi:Bacterial PH domain
MQDPPDRSDVPDLPGLPDLPVTFRPGHIRAVLLAAAVAIFVAIGTVAMLLPLNSGTRVSFFVTGALFGSVFVLLARPKIVADENGVTVTNIIRGRRLEWAEIVQVHLRSGDPWAFLDLGDGTSMAALGIQAGLARRRAMDDVRVLRALVEARTAGGQESPPD